MANEKVGKAIVEDVPNMVRDLTSKAVINTNTTAFEQRLQQIDRVTSQAAIDAKQREDINSLKKDMTEIKKLLKSMANK